MRRIALPLALVLSVACGQASPGGSGHLRPEDLTAAERQAFVYAAVIRHLVEAEAAEPGFIFILDRAVGAAADPDAASESGTPISREVQDRVREELAHLGTVKFVSRRRDVVGPVAQGGRVRNEGVLLTLGPVGSGADRVEVPASTYTGNLGGTWQTLVLRRYGLRWRVEGTTGPVAVS